MNIKYIDGYSQKPKNYSRKMFICNCQCPIMTFDTNTNKKYNIIIDNVMVKYEIEFNKDKQYTPVSNYSKYKYSYTNYQNFGKFKQVIQIPSVFYKLNDEDYVVKVARFERDGVMVPFISEIEILNIKNYEIIKNQLDRKKKLNKIINL